MLLDATGKRRFAVEELPMLELAPPDPRSLEAHAWLGRRLAGPDFVALSAALLPDEEPEVSVCAESEQLLLVTNLRVVVLAGGHVRSHIRQSDITAIEVTVHSQGASLRLLSARHAPIAILVPPDQMAYALDAIEAVHLGMDTGTRAATGT